MARKTSIDRLTATMTAVAREFVVEKQLTASTAVKRIGRKAAANLRAKSPVKSGEYAKGWGMREKKSLGVGTTVEIKNTSKPSLTHLLENGHELRQGGFAPAIPHIRPAFEQAADELRKELGE